MTVGDTDDIDVDLLLNTLFAGAFVTLVTAVAYVIICAIEPLVLVFEYLSGLGGILDTTLSTMLLRDAQFVGKLFISVAISTPLVMFGEVLSAVIPHDDPALGIKTATGAFIISIFATALQKHITKMMLSRGDILGLGLAFIGFCLALGGCLFHEYAHLMAVVGAVIAGVGLAIALGSPDLPGWVGWLDEGVDAVLFGWAVYDAVGE